MHHIKPSIGAVFKILVGAPLFFLLDGQAKGGLLWVQQMATTWEDPAIYISKLVGHFILLDLYDIYLIIKNLFPTSYHFPLKDMPTIYKYQGYLTGLPYRSMDGSSFTELNI